VPTIAKIRGQAEMRDGGNVGLFFGGISKTAENYRRMLPQNNRVGVGEMDIAGGWGDRLSYKLQWGIVFQGNNRLCNLD
jgi:hypothetical protein